MKTLGKRESNRLGRRQAIVEIAALSFMEHGYAGTSMSAIATELGGSKSTLWGYFPSKEDLFAAVMDDATAEFRAQLDDVLTHKGAFAETVLAFCRRFITKVTSPDGCGLYRLVAAESGRFPEVGRIFSSRGREPVGRRLADYFQTQIDEGTMRATDPLRAAHMILSLCLGDLHQRTLLLGFLATPDDVEAEAGAITADFLCAYAIGDSAR
ncbi:MAG: TetR/AcrR family transcriptional regulator [Novosphingobium sp.]